MPLQPTRSDIHVDRPLTNISVSYAQSADDFIHDKVFPILPVQKQSDRYFVYTKGFWFKAGAEKRAPASEAAGIGYHIDNTPTYFCDVWAARMEIPDDDRANADDPLDPDIDATEFVTHNMLLRREYQFVTNYMATGIWQGFLLSGTPTDFQPNANGYGYWDSDTSNPMKDIDSLKVDIKQQTGHRPNTLVVSEDVFFHLRNHPLVLDRIKYTETGIITEDLLAGLFGVNKFLVAGAVLNSAHEGQNPNMGFFTQNQFLLVYSAPAPGLRRPTGGYIFTWTGRFGSGAFGNRIKKYRKEELDADRIEGEMAFDMQVVGADLGVFGYNVVQNP